MFLGLFLLLLVALTTVDWENWWMPGAGIGMGTMEPLEIDTSRCRDVPFAVQSDIEEALTVGQAVDVGDVYQIRVDQIEIGDWVAVEVSDSDAPEGSWIAVQMWVAHKWSPPRPIAWWQPLNEASGLSLYFKAGDLDGSGVVYRLWDDYHGYKANIADLPEPPPIIATSWGSADRSDIATLSECFGSTHADSGQPSYWNASWDDHFLSDVNWMQISTIPDRYAHPQT